MHSNVKQRGVGARPPPRLSPRLVHSRAQDDVQGQRARDRGWHTVAQAAEELAGPRTRLQAAVRHKVNITRTWDIVPENPATGDADGRICRARCPASDCGIAKQGTYRWKAAPPSSGCPRAAADPPAAECASGHVRSVSHDWRSFGAGSGLVWYWAAAEALSSDPDSLAAASAVHTVRIRRNFVH